MTQEKENVAQTVKEIMEVYGGSQNIEAVRGDHNNAKAIIVPKGKTILSLKPILDDYAVKPDRRKGTAHHLDADSFIQHVRRFKGEDSVLYANPKYDFSAGKMPSITGIINYHKNGFDGEPAFGDHRSIYHLTLSDEWKKWTEMDGKTFGTQADFAEFIENNIDNVFVYEGQNEKVDDMLALTGGSLASPSRLMELSRGLSINNNEKVTQRVNPSTGEVSLSYESDHSQSYGSLSVPTAFLIAIPPLLNGVIYTIMVRLRYRLKAGSVQWSYSLFRKEKVFEDAFSDVCKLVKAGTELPLFVGSPEE